MDSVFRQPECNKVRLSTLPKVICYTEYIIEHNILYRMLANRRSHGWIRHRKGEIVEGHEDDIRATFYILAFQREFNDEEAELRWKVVDMMIVGGKIIRLMIPFLE